MAEQGAKKVDEKQLWENPPQVETSWMPATPGIINSMKRERTTLQIPATCTSESICLYKTFAQPFVTNSQGGALSFLKISWQNLNLAF